MIPGYDQRKAFWIVLAAILIIGAVPRVLIYDYSLPYIEDPDEPSLYLLAQEWRGRFEFDDPDYHHGYPPIYPGLNLAVQLITEQTTQPVVMGDVIGKLRLISILFNLLTGLFVALTARQIMGHTAAWLAAAFWGWSPALILQAPKALADPLAVLASTIALWLAVVAATDRQKRHLAVWSVFAGMAGIFVKYPVAPVLGTGGLVMLWVLFKEDRKQGSRYIAYSALIAGIAAVLLWLNNGLAYSSRYVTKESRTTGTGNLLQPGYLVDNLKQAVSPLDPVGPLALVGMLALGVLAFAVARRQKHPQAALGGVGVAGFLSLAQPWAVTSFSVVSETGRIKDVIPATSAIVVLLAVALAQMLAVFPKRWQPLGRITLAIGLGALVFLPQARTIKHIVADYTPPDTRVALRAWSEENLEPGWVLVTYENHKVFNNYWSGLPGHKWFNWYRIEQITDAPLEEWRERGILYAVLPEHQLVDLRSTPTGQAYLDAMLLLRRFYEPPDHRGPEMSVYRLWRMEEEANVSFGDSIRLAGYDWDGADLTAGNSINLRLYWQADSTPQRDYSLFVHIVPQGDRQPVAQWDGPPVRPSRPAYTWNEVTETLISDTISIELPASPGMYRVLLGLYDYNTGQRLPVAVSQAGDNIVGVLGGDSLHLKSITVN